MSKIGFAVKFGTGKRNIVQIRAMNANFRANRRSLFAGRGPSPRFNTVTLPQPACNESRASRVQVAFAATAGPQNLAATLAAPTGMDRGLSGIDREAYDVMPKRPDDHCVVIQSGGIENNT